jgi:hypothetical protein
MRTVHIGTQPHANGRGIKMPIPVSKQLKLQCASDDAHIIADEIETLYHLLDKFWEKHGEELGSRLGVLIPFHEQINTKLVQKVFLFAKGLEPPDA